MKYEPELENDYDLTAMIAKPLYFGMLVNILIPVGLLFICYYIGQRYYPPNHIPDLANALFYVFCAIAFGQAILALWMRNRRFAEPMVKRAESIEFDIASELNRRSRPIFVQIALISIWGYLYFGLTGRFNESVIYVVFSFIVFQFVRPRYGSVKRLIARQELLVKRGKLRGGSLAEIRKEAKGEGGGESEGE